ncbi:MAG TPA: tRNA (N6-threonylcarbamoyladenosine(37)-N6)-methyltransferase TrmO [Anaerolineae bacterium]|nr:tRNA (N6-threonylcarbamoyladenosine(37)-N6)-methyltransferase TrmO [Anaerolineae bacterium]
MKIEYIPIGKIHSPFKSITNMPIQPNGAIGIKGTVCLFPEYIPAVKDLNGFSHIILLYHFHIVKDWQPLVIPFMDTLKRGLFATRTPKRPNPIGLSIVCLLSIEKNILHIENVDILDGTPLLDIKPYVPEFDQYNVKSIGWLKEKKQRVTHQKSDKRFA